MSELAEQIAALRRRCLEGTEDPVELAAMIHKIRVSRGATLPAKAPSRKKPVDTDALLSELLP
jgi:hypothetical protein